MKISIVIPAFNEEKLIGATLSAIQSASSVFDDLGWHSEVIVCDNNSTDRTAQIVQDAGGKVVFEAINQIARARNCGARVASGEWLIFVDADSHPSRELFSAVAKAIEDPRIIGGGCIIKLDRSDFWLRLGVGAWNCLSRLTKWAAGSFIFCEAEAFRTIGGFNNDLFAGEEIDLSIKIKRLRKTTGRRFVILARTPLLTSARKISLYSKCELLSTFLYGVFRPGKMRRTKEKCQVWYDGRR